MEGLDKCSKEYSTPLIASLKLLKNSNMILAGADASAREKYLSFVYMVPVQIFHFASLTAFIVKLFSEDYDLFAKPDVIPIWLAIIEHFIKSTILLINQNKIKEVIMLLGATWRSDGLNETQTNIKNAALQRLRYGEIVFIRCSLIIGWLYHLVPLLETAVRRLVLGEDADLELPFPCVYPFQVNTWPVYLAMFAVQVYCTFRALHIYLGLGWMIVVLTSHLVVQFRLLQEDLIHITANRNIRRLNSSQCSDVNETTESEEQMHKIHDFVIRHQNAILLSNKMNASFSIIISTVLLLATLIICFFAVAGKASTGGANVVKNVVVIFGMLVDIFIICYYSQLLNSSSGGIAQAAAKTVWYKEDMRFQTSICIIIMRAQKPCSLTAMDVFDISLETFNRVLKTTWSYFSLAAQMYDKRG
nr:odorant receptor 15 [Diaphania glauculalis]